MSSDRTDANDRSNRHAQPALSSRLLELTHPYKWHLDAIVLLGLLAAAALRLLAPLPLKIVVDSVIGSEDLPHPLNILFGAPMPPRSPAC
jgi:ATP-binding cassette, subfamily B, bacterial